MITITNFKISDYEAVLTMVSDFQDYIAGIDEGKIVKSFDSRADARKYLDQLIDDVEKMEGAFFVARIDDKIVGFVQGIIDRHKDEVLYNLSHKAGDHGWIGELYVSPHFRNKGVGRELIGAMTDYFKKNGCTSVRLHVLAHNKNAIATYEKIGFAMRNHEMRMEID